MRTTARRKLLAVWLLYWLPWLCGFTVAVSGPEETVWDTTQQCEPLDLLDFSPRAFVDAWGQTQLLATHYHNYRFRGRSLTELRHECTPVYLSQEDPAQLHARYREWIVAPYTEDGATVYGLVHAEWYGELVEPACTSAAPWAVGRVNALTMVRSVDGGAHYTWLAPVWVSPILWQPSYPCTQATRTRYGAGGPSNIVALDGYYYSLFTNWSDPEGYSAETKTCVLRWLPAGRLEIWTHTGWDMTPNVPCAVVAQIEPASVTYNTVLGAYLLVGSNKGTDRWFAGTYAQLSTDLVHWSQPTRILPALDFPNYVYLSLLDESQGSRNFEVTGSDPWLYFVRFFPDGHRALLRMPLRITQETQEQHVPPAPPRTRRRR